jgi:hypothetical protein
MDTSGILRLWLVSYSVVRLFFAKIMRGIRKQPPSKMLANPRPLYGGQPP